MSTPGQQVVQHLRNACVEAGVSAAELASRTDIPTAQVQAMLDGIRAVTIDELAALASALDVELADLLPGREPEPYDIPDFVAPAFDRLTDEPDLEEVLDPGGNQGQQLFQVGFGLGCDFFFHALTSELAGSGIPSAVLGRYREGILPIKLDAAYHRYNEPRYTTEGIHLKLSFDDVYDCFFPWSAIQRIIFSPVAPEPEPEPEPERPKAPFLRLVE